jgi:hypothetical protein
MITKHEFNQAQHYGALVQSEQSRVANVVKHWEALKAKECSIKPKAKRR